MLTAPHDRSFPFCSVRKSCAVVADFTAVGYMSYCSKRGCVSDGQPWDKCRKWPRPGWEASHFHESLYEIAYIHPTIAKYKFKFLKPHLATACRKWILAAFFFELLGSHWCKLFLPSIWIRVIKLEIAHISKLREWLIWIWVGTCSRGWSIWCDKFIRLKQSARWTTT